MDIDMSAAIAPPLGAVGVQAHGGLHNQLALCGSSFPSL